MKNAPFIYRLNFALSGLLSTYKNEASFKIQSFFAIGAVVFLFISKAQPLWWALFIINIVCVLGSELFNTAIENLVDRLHPEQHSSIKQVKDCAAGAVLVFSLSSLLTFICFLIEHFL